MTDFLNSSSWLLAQATTEAVTAAAGEGEAPGAETPSLITQILGNPLNLILFSGILFILLVLRPQQKQMKDLQKQLTELKKNDRVVTKGGIHGTVVQANQGDPLVSLRIDESSGARITIDRDAIAKVEAEEKQEQS